MKRMVHLINDFNLRFLQSICIRELISRSVKHLFKAYMQGVEMMSLTAAISHFLNCYLGSFPTPHANINTEVVSK